MISEGIRGRHAPDINTVRHAFFKDKLAVIGVHTNVSGDTGILAPEYVVHTASSRGIDALVVTGKNSFSAADHAAEAKDRMKDKGYLVNTHLERGMQTTTKSGLTVVFIAEKEDNGGDLKQARTLSDIIAEAKDRGGKIILQGPIVDQNRREVLDAARRGNLPDGLDVVPGIPIRGLSPEDRRAHRAVMADLRKGGVADIGVSNARGADPILSITLYRGELANAIGESSTMGLRIDGGGREERLAVMAEGVWHAIKPVVEKVCLRLETAMDAATPPLVA